MSPLERRRGSSSATDTENSDSECSDRERHPAEMPKPVLKPAEKAVDKKEEDKKDDPRSQAAK